ncbi:23S rRNA (guanosine(2251)-2'-O)-methyltransferase RlmB [Candidatus Kaiserbacteria bacterium RIFCSPLOWO2_12_FULL_52_8]|uniref:23S rRNA (Guanosine(2251)-2'-O)-methyltransferase RlmB n=1 Tax=Candidatus Kaiserbacteria bacterium RIFCSPHIGHO2_01_FULL_53_31 TaxID=1798481 RepID=A0A1F6CH25_9BACT|nr:MAG: 23S rRNA (guanosine(2251)-2'-O)-methyltransferase RlmB [Candidatus Kaiserbacteria bacterium RIFCSPHIGHO2_01_FULL_53_31]OGG93330.1 MAG: 23S rRNA (guanosine(2251)-2'-O)-methyltransferase RlmB [Candidatus Kaiserbacteria bacterium RIFCSPLOWO2_12_FULL_52_8]
MRAKRQFGKHIKHAKRREPLRGKPASGGKIYIYGKHALTEAIQNTPQVIRKVFLARDLHDTELRTLLTKHNIPTAELATGKGKELVGRDTAHQGVIATMDPASLLMSLDDFLKTLDTSRNPAVAVLGEVQDPHNVGAIIRSAAGFGLSGVLIPEHNQAGVTGAVVKSSAGMAFRIPLVSISNVNHALQVLKQHGFWIYGLAMHGTTSLGTETFNAPSAFVVGNEGTGVREKTLETCDVTLSIPMHKRTESLNAAVSGAIVFYEWSRKHPEAL